MKVIILAGGGGSRLFPLSRKSYPKQFLKIEDDKSLLVHTVERFLPMVSAEDIIVVTNAQYRYHVENELAECKAEAAHIVLEPVARNTAPAVALAAAFARDKLSASSDEVLLVAAADHVIRPQQVFAECIARAEKVACDGVIVTLGIRPERAETGYGYIKAGAFDGESARVESFKEKPDAATAAKYLAAGNYYWNSGMFAFTEGFLQSELTRCEPAVMELIGQGYDEAVMRFSEMPNISLDYALAERSEAVRMVPLTCYWNDIGSWDAMYDILPKDASGNAMQGDCMAFDCHNSLIMGRDRLIAGIGFDDLLLVETDDVIVVAKKGESQKVKNVVEELKKRGRCEATEHTTMYHAWGTSEVIGTGIGYRIKKVQLRPGSRLTMQMHYHRSEHWIVVRGTAGVMRGDECLMVHENESVFIPQTMTHRLSNPGRMMLEIIEIQNGSYIGEDDIVRFEE